MELVEPVVFVISGVAPGCQCTWTPPPAECDDDDPADVEAEDLDERGS